MIVKSLEDATFSRLQNKSTEIFKEILVDVFGKVNRTQELQKFGAVSASEVLLVENLEANERMGKLVL